MTEVNSVNKSQETVLIGGIRFLKNEVLGVDKEKDYDFFTVQTTFGRFYYSKSDQYLEDRNLPSIISGELRDVVIQGYEGTKNQDVLHLKNSDIVFADLYGDLGNKDVIYSDVKSFCGWGEGGPHKPFDKDDSIYQEKSIRK